MLVELRVEEKVAAVREARARAAARLGVEREAVVMVAAARVGVAMAADLVAVAAKALAAKDWVAEAEEAKARAKEVEEPVAASEAAAMARVNMEAVQVVVRWVDCTEAVGEAAGEEKEEEKAAETALGMEAVDWVVEMGVEVVAKVAAAWVVVVREVDDSARARRHSRLLDRAGRRSLRPMQRAHRHYRTRR